jgi:hypothetical protein
MGGLLFGLWRPSCQARANFQSKSQLQHCTAHYQGHFLKTSVSIPLWIVEMELILRVTMKIHGLQQSYRISQHSLLACYALEPKADIDGR